jgi:ABC-type branched-chain amino acid transport systems, periplasmic component
MKKIVSIILVVAVVACLCCFGGCGNTATTSGTGTAQPSETGNAQTSGTGTIKIGWLGPETGGAAQYGLAVKNGVDLYIEQLNAAGGINGKQVEVDYYDEEGDATKAVTGYNSLVDDGVVGIIGDVTTGPCTAVVAESQNDNMPMITASATASSITYNDETGTVNSNMFRSCFIDPFQGQTMARFASEVLHAKTAAVLYDNGDTYSTGVREYFVNECKELGIQVVADESYASGSVDFSGQLTNIASAKPDVLFLPVYYNDVALIATQAADAGVKATMLGSDGWSSVLSAVTDPSLIEGAYYCSGFTTESTSQLVVKFLADYAAKYNNEVPNMFAAQGYDAAWILCNAIAKAEQAGVKYGSADYFNAVISAMSATDGDFVTGHISYDDHNDPQKTAAIIQITGGKEAFWGSY